MSTSSKDACCADCLGRIPYASLIAFILTCVGVALFCAMTYQAVNASVDQAKKLNLFYSDVPWLDKIQLSFVIVAVIMCIVALLLLIVGALATGSTRTRVYSGWKARLGGRISCACFLVFTYLLNLCWLAIFALIVVFCFVYVVFGSLCVAAEQSGSQCLNFTVLSPILNGTARLESLVLCGQELRDFCQLSNQAVVWYKIGAFACALAVIGLIHHMVCLAANYAHIKDGFKYFELEEIRTNEENEMMVRPTDSCPASEMSTNRMEAEKDLHDLCANYSSALENLSREMRKASLTETMNETLALTDELQTLTEIVNADTRVSNAAIETFAAKCEQIEELFRKIDQLESFVNEAKESAKNAQVAILKAENDLNKK